MSIFQAGTEDLIQEWISTCNYWAARRSRAPLPGGVTNAEYGWRALESSGEEKDDAISVFSNRSSKSRLSFQNTIGRRNNSLMPITDWQAPQPSLIPSPLEEEAQLESLQKHLTILRRDLKQHQSFEESLDRLVRLPCFRSPIFAEDSLLQYPPRSSSLLKAKENWRNRLAYIHTEIDKYKIYVDALRQAIALRVEKQGEKKLHQSLALESDFEDDDYDEDLYEDE
jgi:PH/SEC7 domain-containing protein